MARIGSWGPFFWVTRYFLFDTLFFGRIPWASPPSFVFEDGEDSGSKKDLSPYFDCSSDFRRVISKILKIQIFVSMTWQERSLGIRFFWDVSHPNKKRKENELEGTGASSLLLSGLWRQCTILSHHLHRIFWGYSFDILWLILQKGSLSREKHFWNV